MFLTAEDLKTLTGYEQSHRQIGWLKSHGWRFEQSRTGRPVVLAKHAEEMLSLANQPRQAPKMHLAAIKKAA
jgi:hypothetical protein